MLRRLCALIVLAGLFGTTPLWAAQLSRPQVEYSADSVMQTEDGTMEQHVYITPAKERHEMLTGEGDGAVQIFRFDSKVMLTLMPSEKMYMEYSMGKAMGQDKSSDMSQWDFQETVVGEEVLNGMKVTKYKTIATSTDGKKYGGFSWRTKEGISMKTDLLYKEGNEKKRMMTELKNLKIGKQDPKLFDVPEGFTKFDMAGMMGGMMGGDQTGRESMGRPSVKQPGMGKPKTGKPDMPLSPDDAPMNSDQSADDRLDIQKAGEAMKKLFGR
jgi:Domain of unknown function (DUF4412)